MLGVQRGVLNKRGLGYKPFIKAKYLKNYFVKASTSSESNITCNYCGNKGHISSSCPIQKKHHMGTKKVWVPKGTKTNHQGPNMIWVPKTNS